MYKVAIVMSTYNGEKYLREQIDSILTQQDVDIDLYIRDDGSSDSTISIINEYRKRHSNIYLSKGKNVGVGNSFMNALYAIKKSYDYYAFSDQDDIWLQNKLIVAINLLKSSGKNLYVSNQECVDKDGKFIKMRFNSTPDLTPMSVLNNNPVAGCTMVFTKSFFELLVEKSHRPSSGLLKNRIHDVWVDMVGAVFETIVYDESSYIQYRQHENNVVGIKQLTNSQVLKKQFDKLIQKEKRNLRSALAMEVLERFPNEVKKHKIIVDLGKYNEMRYNMRVIKRARDFCKYTNESEFSFIIKALFRLI